AMLRARAWSSSTLKTFKLPLLHCFFDCCHQLVRNDWLNQIVYDALLVQFIHVVYVWMTREHKNRNPTELRTEIRDCLNTIHPGHHEVHNNSVQHEGVITGPNSLDRLAAVFRFNYVIARFGQREPNRLPQIGLIIHYQHSSASHSSLLQWQIIFRISQQAVTS